MISLTTDQIPFAIPLILSRTLEAGLSGRFDLDYAMSQAAGSVKAGTGEVFLDSLENPTKVLWVMENANPVLPEQVCSVMFLNVADEARGADGMSSGLDLLRAAEEWGKRRNCKSMNVWSWIAGGPDIGPLLKLFGMIPTEITYNKLLTT